MESSNIPTVVADITSINSAFETILFNREEFIRFADLHDDLVSAHLLTLEGESYETELALIEHLVVADSIGYDEVATHRIPLDVPQGLAHLFQPIGYAQHHYDSASSLVYAFKRLVIESEEFAPILGKLNSSSPWDSDLKWTSDALNASGKGIHPFADSHQNLERLFFYLALAGSKRCPLLLSGAKRKIAETLAIDLTQSFHRAYAQSFKASLAKEQRLVLPHFPVLHLLFDRARRSHGTFSDLILELREEGPVRRYRAVLRNLSQCFFSARSPQAMKSISRDIEKASKNWSSTLVSTGGLSMKRRRISLEKIPIIGILLKTLTATDFELLDPIVWRAGDHLAFVSSWYESKYVRLSSDLHSPRRSTRG